MNQRRTDILMTQQGYDALYIELQTLETKRPTLLAQLDEARALGDRSENAYYKSARGALSRLDGQIRRVRTQIDRARIAVPAHTDCVSIGSSVRLRRKDTLHTYTIVGTLESNIAGGAISYMSPLGICLMGKKKGDIFHFREDEVEVIHIAQYIS